MKRYITIIVLLIGLTYNVKAQSGTKYYNNVTSVINNKFIGSEPINASFTFNTSSIILKYGSSSKSIIYVREGAPYLAEGYKCFDVKTNGNSGIEVEYIIMYEISSGSTGVYNPLGDTILLFE